jgi:hypothetical protein
MNFLLSWFIIILLIFLILYFFVASKGKKSITIKGEKVKSKSEKIIADSLYYLWIDYIYEKDLIIKNKKVANPDFYLPKYNIWIEFWWLNDDKYNQIKEFKMRKYNEYGLKYINIYWNDIRNNKKKYLDKEKTILFLKNEILKHFKTKNA